MKKRALWLLLILLATQSIGCWWFHRPFLVRRWWCHDSCCGAVSHDCCASPAAVDYGPMPPAAGSPNPAMPPATPLSRR